MFTPPVRVVLCDLDDTLYDHRRATALALAGVHANEPAFARRPFDDFEVEHRELLDRLHLDVLSGRRSISEARVERFRRLLIEAAAERPEERAAEVAREYRQAYEQLWPLVAGAAALVDAICRAGVPLVIVTNNTLAEQREKLARCGLTASVRALVTSEEVGVAKPEAAIFHAALERVGVDAAGAVMLGDSWPTDIEGARGVGIRAVWLNRFAAVSLDPSVPELRALEPVAEALRVIVGAGVRPGRSAEAGPYDRSKQAG